MSNSCPTNEKSGLLLRSATAASESPQKPLRVFFRVVASHQPKKSKRTSLHASMQDVLSAFFAF